MAQVQSSKSPAWNATKHSARPKTGKGKATAAPKSQTLAQDGLTLSGQVPSLATSGSPQADPSVLPAITDTSKAIALDGPIPDPDSPIAPFTPEPQLIPDSGGSADIEQDLQGTTVSVRLSPKFKITYRDIENSPTMMNGGNLLKLDYNLTPNTTIFAGAGQLPNFSHQVVGPDITQKDPMTVGFAGIQDTRNKSFNLGDNFKLNLGLNSLAVGTAAYDENSKSLDAATTTGLSKATVTGDVSVSRRFGDMSATVGYGNSLDLGLIGDYYGSGGKGLFPMTHYVDGSIKGKAGPANYELDGYVPIHTASNDFSPVPLARATVSTPSIPYLPDISIEAAEDGTNSIQASKTWRISHNLDFSLSAEADNLVGDGEPWFDASAGLRFTWGGSGSGHAGAAVAPDPDWRQPQNLPKYSGPKAPQKSYNLGQFFTSAQIAAMYGQPISVLQQYLKTPEEVAAYLNDAVQYDENRANETAWGTWGSLTPNQVATLLKGVCRDQHIFAADLMKDASGINAEQIGYEAPETSHAIAVYQDPSTGKWNVMEYGTIHYTEAASAHAAFEEVRPDALTYNDWSQPTDNSSSQPIDINYSPTAREFFNFVTPSGTP